MSTKMRFVRWFPGATASLFITNTKGGDAKLAIWSGEAIVFPNVVYAGLVVSVIALAPLL